MKIAILSDRIPPENAGGAEAVAWRLAVGLQRAGHSVHVITATEREPFREVREGVPTLHIHARIAPRARAWLGVYNPRPVACIRAALRDIEPDVVNAHNVHGALSWSAMSAAHEDGYPTVYTAHDLMAVAYGKVNHFVQRGLPYPPNPAVYRLPRWHNLRQARLRYNPLRNWLIRRILDRIESRVCVGQAQQQALQANGLGDFEVVSNGVEVPDMRQIEGAARIYRTVNLGNRPTVLFAGRLSAEKGAGWLAEAWPGVRARVPDAQILLLARPEVLESLRNQYPALTHGLVAGGWLGGPALTAAFAAADVLVAPSLFLESLPLVALEAMAVGRPVVASAIGGLGEIVQDGVTGLSVPALDTPRLTDSLVTLLQDPAQAERLGRAGRERAERHFSLDGQVSAMLRVYESAIRQRGGP